ncbi:hypothetical protein SAMN05660199_01172 [Klenkia soli]|uniref:Uncharacterized protein n=1 Tax=Klenkia soli TaxID=1052260 RepID=A0A1H0G8U9_9ACTN|nr:hypothetical protein [Klenkia soli]SDO03286.1 hypothetical protein SAMN05660199_01172 [Klenkia soli]
MELSECTPDFLFGLKRQLTRDEKDGILLVTDDEEDFYYTTELAPGWHLYIELHTEPRHALSVGVLRRPRDFIRDHIHADFSSYRIHRGVGRFGLEPDAEGFPEELTEEEEVAFRNRQVEYWDEDSALHDQVRQQTPSAVL